MCVCVGGGGGGSCVRACVRVKQCNANLAVYLNCLNTLLTHLFIIVVLSGSNVYSALSYIIIIIIPATECTVRVPGHDLLSVVLSLFDWAEV